MGQAYPMKQLSPLGPDYRTPLEPFTWPDLSPANDNVPLPANDNGPPPPKRKTGGPPRRPPKPPFGRKPPVRPPVRPPGTRIKVPTMGGIGAAIGAAWDAAQYVEYWSKFKPANAPPGAFAAPCLDGTFSFMGLGTTYCGPIDWADVQVGAPIVGVQDGFGFWNYQIHGYRMHEEGSVRLGTIFTWWTVDPDPWVEEYNRTSTGPMLVPQPNYTFWPNVDDGNPYETPLQTVPITTPSTARPGYAYGQPARGNVAPGVGFYPNPVTGRPDAKPQPNRPGVPTRPADPSEPSKEPPTKERKGSARFGKFAFGVINWVTETQDVVQALHDALPKDCKAKPTFQSRPRTEQAQFRGGIYSREGAWKANKQYAAGWGNYKAPTDYEKAAAIAACFERMDMGKAFGNLVENQIEDWAFGKIGKITGKASRKSGRPIGFQAGPIF